VEKWNDILKRLIHMNLHKNQKYDWVEDWERLVGNYNDAWQSAIKTGQNLAEKGALEDAPPPGQSDTDMGGKFGLNSKGRTLEDIKKIKEGVVGITKVVFKVGDRVRIAIEAMKPLKQRDVALQSNIDRIKWTKEIYEVHQVSIPKNVLPRHTTTWRAVRQAAVLLSGALRWPAAAARVHTRRQGCGRGAHFFTNFSMRESGWHFPTKTQPKPIPTTKNISNARLRSPLRT
jgi:hypothetical protein